MTLDDLHQHPLFTEAVQDSIDVQDVLGLKLTAYIGISMEDVGWSVNSYCYIKTSKWI